MHIYPYSKIQLFFSFIFVLIVFPQFAWGQETLSTQTLETPFEIEKSLNESFASDPIMITIAKCESGFRQYTDSGNVLRALGRYIGIFQIDEIIHDSIAKSLGFDIYTTSGNIGYAAYIYKNEGSNPWRNCAKKYTPPVITHNKKKAVSVDIQNVLGSGQCSLDLLITEKIKLSDRDNQSKTTQVALLQKHINRILAGKYQQPAGPEDGIFGPLTKQGVERLQKALNETLELEKPLIIDGIVGPFTRRAINNSCGTV